MSRCSKLVDMGRRQFLRGSTYAVAGAAVAVSMPGESTAATPANSGSARVDYPSNKLGNVKDLKVNEPLDVTYPDADAPGVLLKLGKKVLGGMGPDGDIVGYSVTCPHKGFPLSYSSDKRTFNCPGHYSVFDAEAGGQEIWGQATSNLPQYSLRIDDKGDIYAEGLDELLYGRLSNVL
ncbi:arsenite oxidase small subunit [Phyllobacterium trifolii]|uniref:Arsenite oxidase small subunit n=1 Tax=Phyllobacterium trifolii TaxID=300193 RepID=A0A839UBA9_9HYPH|nr:arsenate reductase (azurin) small subunit [Phyllobacterium trifolii]MBB3147224.1 arsenite oxidase small subunit [Phyllobacterium trifolii]